MTKLYLAIPCYNEEEVLPNTAEILLNKYQQLMSDNLINTESKICFIDDGSNDKTWSIIKELCNNVAEWVDDVDVSPETDENN